MRATVALALLLLMVPPAVGSGSWTLFSDGFEDGTLDASRWRVESTDWDWTVSMHCPLHPTYWGILPLPAEGLHALYKADSGYRNPDRVLETSEIAIPAGAAIATLTLSWDVCNDDHGELRVSYLLSDGRHGSLDMQDGRGMDVPVAPGGTLRLAFLSNSGLMLDAITLVAHAS